MIRRVVRPLLGLVLALALGACPPPPDPVDSNGDEPVPTVPKDADGSYPRNTDPSTGQPATGPSATELPPPEASETTQAQGTKNPVNVSYEKLRGGVFVARCPKCGEVQPEGSRKCDGCSQALAPWRRETVCSICAGNGDCGRCGDDRECLACDADGHCPFCDDNGQRDGAKCVECGGGDKCADCAGDGWRERFGNDFLPGESALPGACPTCIDGSGICPDCGSSGQDASGAKCLSCAGENLCHECRGTGLCIHDGGDGLCVACEGGGRVVLNGPARLVRERIWNVRTGKGGTVVAGRVPLQPSPNVHVMVRGPDGKERKQALMRNEVDPLSYYEVARSWAETAQDYLNLSVFAQQQRLWPLARHALTVAAEMDGTLSEGAKADLNEIRLRRAEDWLERAAAADKAGSPEHALRLLLMIEFEVPISGIATRAKATATRIRRRLEEERKGLDDAARETAREAAADGVRRTVARAGLRLERARVLLAEIDARTMQDAARERTYRRADRACWSAERLLLSEAYRVPPDGATWNERPGALLTEVRKVRSELAATHAARQTAGGRFTYAARLAQRALNLDGTNPLATRILAEARIGLARRGVERGSPPPREK